MNASECSETFTLSSETFLVEIDPGRGSDVLAITHLASGI
jgi:hypothetical protein